MNITRHSGAPFGNPWWVVAGSTISLSLANGPVMFFTFGLFLTALTTEFGWQRGTVSLSLLIGYILGGAVSPFVGRLVDRYGVRPVAIAFAVLFALSIASLSLTTSSVTVFLTLSALAGFFGGGHAPIPYAKVVSAWFDEKRGLALGIAMTGTGIGGALLPQFTRRMMDAYGWRGAYVGLGALTLAIAVPAIALLVREPPNLRQQTRSASAAALPGVSVGDAVRSFRMWTIGIAAFLVVTTVNGTIGHFVPILNDRGISPQIAAATLSAVGLSTIAGRIIAGYLLDRLFAPYVAAVVFLLPIISLTLLGAGTTGNGPLLAAITLGVSLGAEVDLVGFLVSRYFGLRTFGEIYGYLFGIFTFGTGLGQYLMGLSYDFTHSYNVTLTVFGIFLVIASGLMCTLGPYAYPAGSHEDERKEHVGAVREPPLR